MRSALLFAPDQSEHRKVNADARQDQPHRADGRIRRTMEYEEVQGSGVVVIPLLFETNAQNELDATICVACSAATQRQRLLARGWSPEQIEQRNRAQWPVEQKIAQADYVIWTEAGLDLHAAQLDRILRRLLPSSSLS